MEYLDKAKAHFNEIVDKRNELIDDIMDTMRSVLENVEGNQVDLGEDGWETAMSWDSCEYGEARVRLIRLGKSGCIEFIDDGGQPIDGEDIVRGEFLWLLNRIIEVLDE